MTDQHEDTSEMNRCIECGGPLVPCTCRPNCPGGMCPECTPRAIHGEDGEAVAKALRSITSITGRPQTIGMRPERVKMPPTDEVDGYMLEMFELGDGPIGSGQRHAVWLHRLKTGGYRWKCSCGTQQDHATLNGAVLAEARTHFDEPWAPAAVPLGAPFCLWNDRVQKDPPPSADELEKLACDLFAPPDELARRRNKGKLPSGVEVVHFCGLCGQTFEIKPTDPHWVTGRGPICPPDPPAKEPA